MYVDNVTYVVSDLGNRYRVECHWDQEMQYWVVRMVCLVDGSNNVLPESPTVTLYLYTGRHTPPSWACDDIVAAYVKLTQLRSSAAQGK
jgi:hypothetical protein